MTRRFGFLAPLGLAVLLQLGASASSALVERWYARGLYPRIAALVSWPQGLVPFALADAMPLTVIVVLALAAWRLVGRMRARGWRALGAAARMLVGVAGLAYLMFLLSWGLNYRREPLAASLGLAVAPAPLAELEQLATDLVTEANLLRAGRAESEGVFVLERGHSALFALPAAGARPKASRLSPALARLGISGIFVPFTGEPLVNTLLPDSELPFGASHELAHAQGWAREDEANFLAFRACRAHDDPDFRYSGVLAGGRYVVNALAAVDGAAAQRVVGSRSAAVGRDIDAIHRYQRRYEGRLARAGERLNDVYLRSQGQDQGVRSYGRMVDLLLAERRARTSS